MQELFPVLHFYFHKYCVPYNSSSDNALKAIEESLAFCKYALYISSICFSFFILYRYLYIYILLVPVICVRHFLQVAVELTSICIISTLFY